MDMERLAAFTLITGATSLVPGLSMLFVMAQAISHGTRAGVAGLLGLQLGYGLWWVLAGMGMGALATAYPGWFTGLAVAGALYLAWMGWQYIRTAGAGAMGEGVAGKAAGAEPPVRRLSRHAFRDGMLVALGNPKSLVYMVALVPPFVDARLPVWPQLGLMALIACIIDLLLGAVYIIAGSRLAQAMTRPVTRRRLDRGIGVVLMLVSGGILADLLLR